jgi:hypothetical protein
LIIFLVPILCIAEGDLPTTVINVINDVYVIDGESGETMPVEEGMELHPGDLIKTLDAASVVLETGADLVKLDPNTFVTIRAVGTGNGGRGNTALYLHSGIVYARVENRTDDSLFSIVTAGSVIEAREADFAVESIVFDTLDGEGEREILLNAIDEEIKEGKEIHIFSVEVTTTVVSGSVTSAIISSTGESIHTPVVLKKGEEISDRFDHVILEQ